MCPNRGFRHTRAIVTINGPATVAVLRADGGAAAHDLTVRFSAVPAGACGGWQVAPVVLPVDPPRFPVDGARKMWLVCSSNLTKLEVTLTNV